MSETYKKFKAASASQKPSRDAIRDVLSEGSSRTAAIRFDLSDNTKVTTGMTVQQRAMAEVAAHLAQFNLPGKPKLAFLGLVKTATSDGKVQEGIVRIGATIRTVMGNKTEIEFPINIRKGGTLEPALFFWNGSPYVTCQTSLDLVVKNGTLQKNVKNYRMFTPPFGEQREETRRPITNLEHMFSPGARNPLTFHRQYSKEAAGFVAPSSMGNTRRRPMYWHDFAKEKTPEKPTPAKPAEPTQNVHQYAPPQAPVGPQPGKQAPEKHVLGRPLLWNTKQSQMIKDKKETRKRVNIDEAVAFTDPSQNTMPDSMLDTMERDQSKWFHTGDEVKLSSDCEVRERGGTFLVLPKGETGEVVRDMHGDGTQIFVEFQDLGLAAVIPANFLKSAAVQEEQVIHEIKALKAAGYGKIDICDTIHRLYPQFSHLVDDE